MFDLARSFRNLSATSAMTAAAAGIFVGIIAPLTGGLPKPYEFREFQAGVTAYMNGETSTPSLEPAYYPRRAGVQIMPAIASADEGYQYVSARVEEERTLQTADLEQLAPIEAAAPDGAVVEAMQVLEEPLVVEPETIEEPLQAEEIIVEINPDDVKGIES